MKKKKEMEGKKEIYEYLLPCKDSLAVEVSQLFICCVDTQLFKKVYFKSLRSKYIK